MSPAETPVIPTSSKDTKYTSTTSKGSRRNLERRAKKLKKELLARKSSGTPNPPAPPDSPVATESSAALNKPRDLVLSNNELTVTILLALTKKDLLSSARVCRAWNLLALECVKHYPISPMMLMRNLSGETAVKPWYNTPDIANTVTADTWAAFQDFAKEYKFVDVKLGNPPSRMFHVLEQLTNIYGAPVTPSHHAFVIKVDFPRVDLISPSLKAFLGPLVTEVDADFNCREPSFDDIMKKIIDDSTNVQTLRLWNSTDPPFYLPPAVATLSYLRSVHLRSFSAGRSLTPLSSLPNLVSLTLSDPHWGFTSRTPRIVLSALKTFEVDGSDNHSIGDDMLCSLEMPQLRRISFRQEISFGDILALSLKSLLLEHVVVATESVTHFGQRRSFENLQSLTVHLRESSGRSPVSDNDIKRLVEGMPLLRHLVVKLPKKTGPSTTERCLVPLFLPCPLLTDVTISLKVGPMTEAGDGSSATSSANKSLKEMIIDELQVEKAIGKVEAATRLALCYPQVDRLEVFRLVGATISVEDFIDFFHEVQRLERCKVGED